MDRRVGSWSADATAIAVEGVVLGSGRDVEAQGTTVFAHGGDRLWLGFGPEGGGVGFPKVQVVLDAQRVGVQRHCPLHGLMQTHGATTSAAQQSAEGGDIFVGVSKQAGQAVQLPERAQVSIVHEAVAHQSDQHRGQAAPTVVAAMPVDGRGGGGMGGRAVNGAGCPVIVAGTDVAGDEAQVQLAAVQVMVGVQGHRLL